MGINAIEKRKAWQGNRETMQFLKGFPGKVWIRRWHLVKTCRTGESEPHWCLQNSITDIRMAVSTKTPSLTRMLSPITGESSWLVSSHSASNPSSNSVSSISKIYPNHFSPTPLGAPVFYLTALKTMVSGQLTLVNSPYSSQFEASTCFKDIHLPWHQILTPYHGKGALDPGYFSKAFPSTASQHWLYCSHTPGSFQPQSLY